MAKLTARFDLQDRITKKLRSVRAEAERLERSRARLNKPILMTVRDRASRPLRSLGRFIRRDLAKVHRISMAVRDRASGPISSIGNLIRTRFPRTHQMLLRARDRATPVLQRLNTYMRGNILKARWMVVSARDRATPVVRRIATYTRMALSRGYSFTIRAIDRVTRTAGRMGAHINRAIPKVVNSTIRVVDLATRPLQMIARAATSTLGLLGVAGGIGGGIVIPIKMVAEREDLTTAFEVMLGSADAANKRMEELTDFAGRTPLTRDEIFRSSRVLQTFTGDALATAKGMELVGDVAVGTQTPLEETAMWFGRLYDGLESGRPIGMATNRLQEMGAISGEARDRIEKLGESGKDIAEIWPAVTKEFGEYNGMMEKMSDNTNNLLLGLKSFVQNSILMPWGEGLRDALKPALKDFRTWRNEYSFVLRDMSDRLKNWGGQFADGILRPTSGFMKVIGDQMKILFPGKLTQELEMQMKDDPELKKRFDELEEYRDMSFKVRWELVKTNVGDGISEWWETKGRDQAARVGNNIGRTYGGFIHSALIGLLGGTAEETGNPFIDSGITAGKNFISGFIEALDPAKLATAIGKALYEANVGAMKSLWGKLTGNKELEESGSIMGAVIGNALVLAFMAKVGRMLRNLKPLLDAAMNAGGWLLGRGKGGKVPTPIPLPGTPKNPKQPRTPKGKPDYRMPWFGKGDKPILNGPNQDKTKMPGGLGKAMRGIGNLAKRIPVLGTVIGGLSIATADDKTSATAGVAGGAGGALAGGAIGSAVPIIGTTIGAIIGGIIGAIGGEKIVTWVQDNWNGIKKGASNAGQWVANTWNKVWNSIVSGATTAGNWISDTWNSIWSTVKGYAKSFSSWFMTSVWDPIKNGATTAGEWISEKVQGAADWIQEKWSVFSSWFDSNVWTPILNAAINTMNFFVGAWDYSKQAIEIIWGTVKDWFMENVWNPIEDAAWGLAQRMFDAFRETAVWVNIVWANIVTWFEESVWTPIKEGVTAVGTWIVEKYSEAKEWVVETWSTFSEWFNETIWEPVKLGAAAVGLWIYEKYLEAKEWVIETWLTFASWFDETIWTPVKEGATAVGLWIYERYQEAKAWIEEQWATFSGWFDGTVWEPIKTGAAAAGLWIYERYQEAKGWIEEQWSAVSGWFESTVWGPIRDGATALGEWIGVKFGEAVAWAQNAWAGVVGWFNDNVWGPLKEGAESAWSYVSGLWDDAKGWASQITGHGEKITGVTPDKNATGGHITRPTLSWVGEAGNEYVIPTQNNTGRGRMLLQQAASDLGMQVSDRDNAPQIQAATTYVDNGTLNKDSQQALNGLATKKSSSGGNDVHVEVVFTGDNHYSNDFDAEKHGHLVVKVVKDHLEDELNTGGEGIYDL